MSLMSDDIHNASLWQSGGDANYSATTHTVNNTQAITASVNATMATRFAVMTPSDFVYYLLVIKRFLTPVIIIVGVPGNVIVTATLMRSPLSKFSSSHYLSAIAIANTVYLSVLALTYITMLGHNVYDRPMVCQFVFLTKDMSSFLSVWLPVSLCVDRYIAICWPAEAPKMCTVMRTHAVAAALVSVGLVVYLNKSITVGVVRDSMTLAPRCNELPLAFNKSVSLEVLNLLFNHLLPYVVITLLLGAICLADKHSEPSQIRRTTIAYFLFYIVSHAPQDVMHARDVHMSSVQPSEHSVADVACRFAFSYLSHLGMAGNVFILLASYPLFRQYVAAKLRRVSCVNWRSCRRSGGQAGDCCSDFQQLQLQSSSKHANDISETTFV